DAAAVVVPVGGRGGDVVGHQEDGDVRALGAQAAGGRTEVEHVAGVVAERDEDACARVGGAAHVEHLAGRRGREDVAADGGVGQAVADQAGEGRVVPGPAADDDGDLARAGAVRAGDAAGDGTEPARVGLDETAQGLGDEVF